MMTFDSSFEAGVADMRAQFAEIRAEMRKDTNLIIRWAIGLSVFVVAATVGLVTWLDIFPGQPAAPQPAPLIIVITVPGATVTVPTPAPKK